MPLTGRLLGDTPARSIMQDDGAHQSLENELLVDLTLRSRRGSGSLSTPPPHPIPSRAEQHVLGQRIYSLRTQSRPNMGAKLVHKYK